ncbi:MAG TPA: hypothetical protein VF060_07260 [Trebonia sp.]
MPGTALTGTALAATQPQTGEVFVQTAADAGTVDATASPGGQYLYAQTGANGIVDEYHVAPGGALTKIGSVTVPNAAGGEGIAAS